LVIQEYRDFTANNHGSRGRRKEGKRVLSLACDKCSAEFKVSGGQVKVQLGREKHFCSRKCAASSVYRREKTKETIREKYGEMGLSCQSVREKKKETSLRKFGVDNPAKSDVVQRKTRETWIEKYENCHPLRSEEVKQKIRETCIERYGVDNPWKSSDIQEKSRNTCIERYGVDNAAKSGYVQQKIRATNFKRLGVGCVLQSEETKKKIRETCLEKYGCETPPASKEIKNKIHETCLEKYDVNWACMIPHVQESHKTPAAKMKKYLTHKKNRTHGKSKIEDRFYEYLKERYLDSNIERHVLVNGWNIDIKINDVYVQFDGIYWHGLNRSIDEIQKLKSKRDTQILKTYHRDRDQEAWFAKSGIFLVRVTDRDFQHDKDTVSEVFDAIIISKDVKKILSDGKIGRVGTTR
jgi:hypothetical protein